MANSRDCVLPHALKLPAIEKLKGKRIVLASSSPRRKEIFQRCGLKPEVVPSTFEENLPQSSFQDLHEYPVATASHKAVEVYERLVRENPDDPPDLVIAADTVVLTHVQPLGASQFEYVSHNPEILEKPVDKADNYRMLMDLNGGVCEAVTGVALAYPVLVSPGYEIKCMEERTLVFFADNPKSLIEAYVDSGEGIDRAGGFTLQGTGALLVKKVEGDYNNVIGFPAAAFFKFLELIIEEDSDFLNM